MNLTWPLSEPYIHVRFTLCCYVNPVLFFHSAECNLTEVSRDTFLQVSEFTEATQLGRQAAPGRLVGRAARANFEKVESFTISNVALRPLSRSFQKLRTSMLLINTPDSYFQSLSYFSTSLIGAFTYSKYKFVQKKDKSVAISWTVSYKTILPNFSCFCQLQPVV